MKIRFYFKWFDFWVGWFYDKQKKRLYIGLLPMVGILFEFSKEPYVDWTATCFSLEEQLSKEKCRADAAVADLHYLMGETNYVKFAHSPSCHTLCVNKNCNFANPCVPKWRGPQGVERKQVVCAAK